MDDARALFPADAAKRRAVPKERIDKGPVTVPTGWVDDQPCWFVEGKQIIVLVKNGQGDVLWDKIGRLGRGKGQDKCAPGRGGEESLGAGRPSESARSPCLASA